ncbi:MAG: FAD-dependent monooxygenase, partial [Gammaproteobacteria bacterium]
MYDFIVVGARCAGSSVSMLLARKGYRVLLLDRDSFPSDMPMSTHLVHQRGVACLSRWGLRDQLLATQSTPINRCDIDFGPFTLSGCPPPVDGESAGFAPRRILLDDILVRAAAERCAEIRENHRVDALRFEDKRVVGVSGVSANGGGFTERARLVIGADGPSSCVARAIQAEEYNTKPALQATAWMYWDGIPMDRVELHQRKHEAIYTYPSSNGSTLVGANWTMDK